MACANAEDVELNSGGRDRFALLKKIPVATNPRVTETFLFPFSACSVVLKSIRPIKERTLNTKGQK
jgi:hypothetical protein